MNSDTETTLNQIVAEYLTHTEYSQTLACFKDESRAKGLSLGDDVASRLDQERIENIQVRTCICIFLLLEPIPAGNEGR